MCTIAITTSKSCKVLETTHLRFICDAIFMVDEVGSSHPPFLCSLCRVLSVGTLLWLLKNT